MESIEVACNDPYQALIDYEFRRTYSGTDIKTFYRRKKFILIVKVILKKMQKENAIDRDSFLPRDDCLIALAIRLTSVF